MFATFGPVIISKMLRALLLPSKNEFLFQEREHAATKLPSASIQKLEIKRHSHWLSFDSKLTICRILNMHGKRDDIKECGRDLVIDLDALHADIIEHIYIFVKYSIERSSNVAG